jgi:hypothetical protein
MADTKISDLADGSPIVGSDLLIVSRSGVNYRVLASSMVPAIVTSLPGSPSNGDEVYYKVGSSDDAVLWRLKYDSSITDAYKWRYVGGTPLLDATEINPSGAGTALPVIGAIATIATLAAPLAGKYDVDYEVAMRMHTGVTDAHAFIYIGTTQQAVTHTSKGVDSAWQREPRQWRATLAASDIVNLKVYTDIAAANALYWGRSLRLTPVRVG